MATLSHRERVVKALNHEEADRVPVDLGSTYVTTININAYPRLLKHLGMEDEPGTVVMRPRSQIATPSETLLQYLDIDLRGMWFGGSDQTPETKIDENTLSDEFGVVWNRPDGGHYLAIESPFQKGQPTVADVERFNWPDPRDPGRTRGMLERARYLHDETDYAVVLSLPYGIVADCARLRGFAEFFTDLVDNTAFAEALLDHMAELTSGMMISALEQVGEYVDVALFPDDMGMQDMCLVSPDMYRRLLKPRHRKLVDAIKSKTKAKVLMHSDGSIYPIIGDLIDIGVDALNPIQVSARQMDSDVLKREFGHHLAFWGAIDTHRVLPMGTPEDVEAEVRKTIGDLAPGGGYVLTSVHNIQSEVPPENMMAMYKAARQWGTYSG
ncbi:MAG: uroporphyrinogen decarboxylase family protein [Dehalococcoidia bacterium]|jgi:uroporphyrinogen decarboxylase|nr:uroporphyrinogen decarboxylase family protein [Dehalococcoidia bacterium]MDP7510997.1 uroporphyrinogen decarboxylase family protein [Dehalococcoidia bacterium]